VNGSGIAQLAKNITGWFVVCSKGPTLISKDRQLPSENAALRSAQIKSALSAMLKIGRMLRKSGLPLVRAEGVGWTKLHLIADHAEPQHAASLLKLAERMTVQKLEAELRKDSPFLPTPRCVQLYFNAGQYQAFRRAVVRYGGRRARRGLSNKEQAIIRNIRAAGTRLAQLLTLCLPAITRRATAHSKRL
jgi:hypothetical protein